ncbi:hypothetical protein LCGC14_2730720 [marine sediment metagenome]|uniref:Uncharacterized protein n=1 Tax=marine sediment metagenome TaxID=412755 RepID=A0A0F9BZ22_9ZZZZ
MSRTYVKGRKGFSRTHRRCPHGHCYICGYDPRTKGQKKKKQKALLKFDILPYINYILINKN